MSEDNEGPVSKGRRGFNVGGEAAQTRAPKARSIDAALRLDVETEPKLEEGERAYNPERVRAFLAGRITLGDLEGITKQEQYQMAEIGHSYISSGKLPEAKTVFEGLIALDPFDAYFHTALGSIAQQSNDLEEAEARYTRALEINPYSATAMANRGEIRVQQGRLAEGTEDLIKAVQADPKGTEPATVRAQSTLNVLREQLSEAAKAAGVSRESIESADPSASPEAGASPAPKAKPPGTAPVEGPAPSDAETASPAVSSAAPRSASPTPPRSAAAPARAASQDASRLSRIRRPSPRKK